MISERSTLDAEAQKRRKTCRIYHLSQAQKNYAKSHAQIA